MSQEVGQELAEDSEPRVVARELYPSNGATASENSSLPEQADGIFGESGESEIVDGTDSIEFGPISPATLLRAPLGQKEVLQVEFSTIEARIIYNQGFFI